MKNTLAAFKSPLLAQARLLGFNDSNDLEFFHNRDKIQANNPCKNTMSNISTLPRFNSSQTESERTDFGLPVAELVKFFERKAKSTYLQEARIFYLRLLNIIFLLIRLILIGFL
jgi:hypothetical protein